MRTFFWLAAGAALGAFGYRYYEQNGNRLPVLERLTGRRTEDLMDQAASAVKSAQGRAQEAVGENVAGVTRQTVAAVAEEIADAEKAKRREQARQAS